MAEPSAFGNSSKVLTICSKRAGSFFRERGEFLEDVRVFFREFRVDKGLVLDEEAGDCGEEGLVFGEEFWIETEEFGDFFDGGWVGCREDEGVRRGFAVVVGGLDGWREGFGDWEREFEGADIGD
jgi:hypothetical protein